MKLKLNTQYPSNNIITTIFLKDKGKNEYKQVEDIVDVDSFSKYVCYQCKLKAIIAPVKLWCQASNIKDASYGVTFKIIKAQVDPPINTSISMKDYLNNTDGFLNSDSEEEVVENNASSSSHKKEELVENNASSSHKKEEEEEEEEEEEDNEEDNEEESE